MAGKNTHPFFNLLLFGNVFYAFCAVALSIETLVQLHLNFKQWPFYLALFLGTMVFYMTAYLNTSAGSANPRLQWYRKNRNSVLIFMLVALLLIIIMSFELFATASAQLNLQTIVLLAVFPLAALFYYGDLLKMGTSLRRYGFLKPFIVAFVWSGAVTIYPTVFAQSRTDATFRISADLLWFFLKNLMFIASLCILFDIKDYADDANANIKTFVVRFGLRKTLYRIIVPLVVFGWLSLVLFSLTQGFSLQRLLINTISFAGLLWVSLHLRQKRPIFFYLFAIDGLMLVKACCGVFGALV